MPVLTDYSFFLFNSIKYGNETEQLNSILTMDQPKGITLLLKGVNEVA